MPSHGHNSVRNSCTLLHTFNFITFVVLLSVSGIRSSMSVKKFLGHGSFLCFSYQASVRILFPVLRTYTTGFLFLSTETIMSCPYLFFSSKFLCLFFFSWQLTLKCFLLFTYFAFNSVIYQCLHTFLFNFSSLTFGMFFFKDISNY